MREHGVQVDLRSVRKSWRENAYGEFWVQLRTQNKDVDASFFEAINGANDAEPYGGLLAEFPAQTPAGYVTLLRSVEDDAHLERWTDDLAARSSESA